jgi:hypothetical protein
MSNHNANVIVYVKQADQSRSISETIAHVNGVRKASISERVKSFICVDYDPRTTDSMHILKSVTSQGFNARLVGM